MIRPSVSRFARVGWLFLALRHASDRVGPRQALGRPETTPGQFFTITEPITNETIQHIRLGHPPACRSKRWGRAGKESDPGLRVPSR